MRKTIFLAVFCLGYFVACKNEKPQAPAAIPVVESAKLKQQTGADCGKPDSLQSDCAVVDLSWPVVKTGAPALQASVAAWNNKFLLGMLSMGDTVLPNTTLETAVKAFLQAHTEWKKETPDFDGSFYAQTWDTLLLNDGKFLTPFVAGDLYTGGAHGGQPVNIATFNAQNGTQLNWTDLVTDTAAVKKLAEKKFREVRAEDFKPMEDGSPGFNFDDTFVFQLPSNFGLTDKGIYLYYVPYEVAPYAFGQTDFLLTFEELGAYYKKPLGK